MFPRLDGRFIRKGESLQQLHVYDGDRFAYNEDDCGADGDNDSLTATDLPRQRTIPTISLQPGQPKLIQWINSNQIPSTIG